MVECYFWSYTVYYEQEYTRARMILARLFMLASLLDDTYDVHATLEECRKLNEAIQRLGLVIFLCLNNVHINSKVRQLIRKKN